MKFHKLSAAFGKLKNQTLEPGDGLTIIEGPNEGGKSTWAVFLRAMLYGIDTRERDKKGVIAEKNRYQPWEGGAMEGCAELTWGGKEITLRRTTARANAPMGRFEAVYTGTEEPVPELTGETAGELLTGVGREVFERSAFVGQCAVPIDSAPELERRVAAIVTSGQEDVSYSQAEKRLREWRNRRQSNLKNGLIPKLEEERAQVRASLERLEGAARQAAAARAEKAVLERERAVLEEERQAHRQAEGAAARARYDAARAELDQAQAAWEALQAERAKYGTPPGEEVLRSAQGDLSYLNTLEVNIRMARQEEEQAPPPPVMIEHPVFGGMEPAAVRERAEADAKTAREHREEAGSGGVPPMIRLAMIGILFFAGAAILLINFVFHGNSVLYTIVGVLTVLGVLAVGIYHIVTGWRRTMRVFQMLDSYGVREAEDIINQAKEYIARWEEADEARTQCAVRAVTRERLEAERDDLTAQLLELAHGFAPEVSDLYGVSAAISRALNLQEKEKNARLRVSSAQAVFEAVSAQGAPPEAAEGPQALPERTAQEIAARLDAIGGELSRLNSEAAMAQGEMNTLGSPAALQARLGELEGELTRRREEYEALNLALDALKQANAELQSRFSPALNEKAGELMQRLTGGKYDRISLTREFEALVAESGGTAPRKALTLSQGTVDQLYLAVRLAVCQLALPQQDPPPLVLDDALVNFDDERMKLALDLLRALARDRQILLFTCHSRESAYLKDAGDVKLIRMES